MAPQLRRYTVDEYNKLLVDEKDSLPPLAEMEAQAREIRGDLPERTGTLKTNILQGLLQTIGMASPATPTMVAQIPAVAEEALKEPKAGAETSVLKALELVGNFVGGATDAATFGLMTELGGDLPEARTAWNELSRNIGRFTGVLIGGPLQTGKAVAKIAATRGNKLVMDVLKASPSMSAWVQRLITGPIALGTMMATEDLAIRWLYRII